jgi:hypothetical protein
MLRGLSSNKKQTSRVHINSKNKCEIVIEKCEIVILFQIYEPKPSIVDIF